MMIARARKQRCFFSRILVKEWCDEIERCDQLVALRLEGNTINEAAATAIGQALEKHSEIQVMICQFDESSLYSIVLQRLIWNDLFTTRLKTEVPPSLVRSLIR